jgi:arsenate reductase
MKIYHNPRCSKSRQTLEILIKKNANFEIVEYLKDKLSITDLEDIIAKLEINTIELVRKNESVWKEKFKGRNLNDKEIIQAMIDNPKIIERPIVVNGNKAILGRPPENVLNIID